MFEAAGSFESVEFEFEFGSGGCFMCLVGEEYFLRQRASSSSVWKQNARARGAFQREITRALLGLCFKKLRACFVLKQLGLR